MQIGVIGDITFQVSSISIRSINYFDRNHEWKYAQHEIITGKSRLQGLGRQLDSITVSGEFLDLFCIPYQEMQRLIQEAEKKEALTVVMGDKLLGEYVIEKIQEVWKETDGEGNPRQIYFQVTLKEYY